MNVYGCSVSFRFGSVQSVGEIYIISSANGREGTRVWFTISVGGGRGRGGDDGMEENGVSNGDGGATVNAHTHKCTYYYI